MITFTKGNHEAHQNKTLSPGRGFREETATNLLSHKKEAIGNHPKLDSEGKDMGIDKKKQLRMLTEAIKRQKKSGGGTEAKRHAVITSEAKPSAKRGLYISKDSLIGLLNKIKDKEFRLLEATSPYSILVAIPNNIRI
jgi:hypothetical protein